MRAPSRLLLLVLAGASMPAVPVAADSGTDDGPSARDLAQAELLSNASDQPLAARDAGGGRRGRLVYDLRLDLGVTAAGNEADSVLRYEVVQRPLGPTVIWQTGKLLTPREHRVYPSLRAAAGAEWEVERWLLLRGLLDSGEIRQGDALKLHDGVTLNGGDPEEELRALSPLRELSVTFGTHDGSLELGRFRASVAQGLIYEDFGNGARLRGSTGRLGAEALVTTLGQELPSRGVDPLVALSLQYELGFLETIALFGAYARDSGGPLVEATRAALALSRLDDPQSLDALMSEDRGQAGIAYVGADAQVLLGGFLVRGTFALQIGRVVVRETEATDPTQTHKNDVKLRGVLGAAEAHYPLDAFDFALHALWLSGDAPAQDGGTYHAFLGLAPSWTWSGLFFSGGLHQGLSPSRSMFAGMHGHGVIGAGPTAGYHPSDSLDCELRVLWLSALADPLPGAVGGDGRSYGLETDVRVSFAPWEFMRLGAEVDVLLPADYFPEHSAAYRALAIVTVLHGS